MKRMKKVFAMLLAFAMVMGMSLTTFAANATTITVNGMADTEDAAVTYVQVVEPDTTNVTGWKFTDTAYATAFRTAFSVTTNEAAIEALIALGALENYNQYASAGTINVSSNDFAEALADVSVPATSLATEAGDVWTISAAKAGLYVINASATGYSYIPMAAYVGYNATDKTALVPATVTVKGSETKIEKSIDNDDNKSVAAGDVVDYTATTEYPYYPADETNKTFTVSDTLTNATFVASSLVVTVDGVEQPLVAGTDYTVNQYAETNALNISFEYNSTYAGKDVTIKYSALVGSGEGDVTNAIKTNFDTTGDSVKLDKVQVTVTKVSDDATPVALANAEFKIYKEVTQDTEGVIVVADAKVYGVEGTTTLYLKEIATGTTNAEGKVVFNGLDAQERYYIKETVAPEGYSLNDNYYKLDPTAERTAAGSQSYVFDNFADTTVVDTKLSALPSTGGIGTAVFTIGGCAIMVAAAYFFLASRKKES